MRPEVRVIRFVVGEPFHIRQVRIGTVDIAMIDPRLAHEHHVERTNAIVVPVITILEVLSYFADNVDRCVPIHQHDRVGSFESDVGDLVRIRIDVRDEVGCYHHMRSTGRYDTR